MSNTIRVSRLAFASALVLCGTIPVLAQSVIAPALTLTDNTNIVTINGSGSVSVTQGTASITAIIGTGVSGNPCSGAGCYPVGAIVVNGTIGNFTVANMVGQGMLAFGSTPSIDLGASSIVNNGAAQATLTATFTDIKYTGTSPSTITTIEKDILGTSSVTYTLYVDTADTPFGGTSVAPDTSTVTKAATQMISGAQTSTSYPATPVMATAFSMTVVEAISVSASGLFSNDFGGITSAGGTGTGSNPMIMLSKCVAASGSTTTCATGPVTVAPFTKVTYLYTVKNTSTGTTLPVTSLKITDDNATPDYPADDFTVCTIASLAPGASQTCTATVYPPITEGANDCSGQNFNYGNYHAGGILICQQLSNGDINFHWVLDEKTIDNTYGTGASPDWPSGASFSWLPNNSEAEFQIYDSKGNKCLDFVNAYVGQSSGYPSGWGAGGTVSVTSGNGGNIVKCDTSLSQCLNRNQATAQCVSNSPVGAPDWNKKCAYIVHVSANCWGSNGFGSIQCPWTSNKYTKNGQCEVHECKPVN